jgi:hypothetical protein
MEVLDNISRLRLANFAKLKAEDFLTRRRQFLPHQKGFFFPFKLLVGFLKLYELSFELEILKRDRISKS